jgi:hypothetical protein
MKPSKHFETKDGKEGGKLREYSKGVNLFKVHCMKPLFTSNVC